MTLKEFLSMPNDELEKWQSEHSDSEWNALVAEWLEQTKRDSIDYNVKRVRERRKMYEISKAVMAGQYSGITSDGNPWRIDFSDSHVDDWRDEYFNSDYEEELNHDEH